MRAACSIDAAIGGDPPVLPAPAAELPEDGAVGATGIPIPPTEHATKVLGFCLEPNVLRWNAQSRSDAKIPSVMTSHRVTAHQRAAGFSFSPTKSSSETPRNCPKRIRSRVTRNTKPELIETFCPKQTSTLGVKAERSPSRDHVTT